MINLESFDYLEKNNVFIHYSPEHYNDGSNLIFSIEFVNFKNQTCWYNDNHEFGGVTETIKKSIALAMWHLEDTKRISLISSGYSNPEYVKYEEERHNFIKTLLE